METSFLSVQSPSNPFIMVNGFDDAEKFVSIIVKYDNILSSKDNNYLRINEFPKLLNDITKYTNIYDKLENEDQSFRNAIEKTISIFKTTRSNITDTIAKNFAIKLIFWADFFLNEKKLSKNSKIVFHGNIKTQEFLGLYFLSLLGINILYLNTKGEQFGEVIKYAKVLNYPNFKEDFLPNFKKNLGVVNRQNIAVKIPERSDREKTGELDFEKLATFANKVVMITVLDEKGGVLHTGSGIIINRKGYILTNFHVAAGGHTYSVKIENCEESFKTTELLKYNQVLDLAVISIDVESEPLELYYGSKELLRGQSVVAIGSPLGLFNSVSDGIISGFRDIDGVDMIQFTAPISSGSSGGALLNRQGELIGISTAGFDKGQNINLAVKYTEIYNFIRGFL